jgi:hypothetical protein
MNTRSFVSNRAGRAAKADSTIVDGQPEQGDGRGAHLLRENREKNAQKP